MIDAVIPTDTNPGFDGGVATDAHIGTDATATVDARPTVDAAAGATFVSNLPGTILINQLPNIDMLSSNLLQSPSGSNTFHEWLGEFRNIGGTLLCLVDATVNFRKTDGTLVVSFQPAMFADAYAAPGITFSIPCTAPDHVATLYDNGFVPAPADLTGVTQIEIAFTMVQVDDAVPAAEAPAIATQPAPAALGGTGISGTLTGRAGVIDDILYSAFPRGNNPLVLGFVPDSSQATLSPGQVHAFTTLIGISTAFTSYREYVDFEIVTPAAATSPRATAADLAIATRAHQRRQELALRAKAALASKR